MNTEDTHSCKLAPGWEIRKEDSGLWQLHWYYPKSSDDPGFKPLPEVIDKYTDWRTLGYWDLSRSTALVIRYCPWCGEKLIGNEEFYREWERLK